MPRTKSGVKKNRRVSARLPAEHPLQRYIAHRLPQQQAAEQRAISLRFVAVQTAGRSAFHFPARRTWQTGRSEPAPVQKTPAAEGPLPQNQCKILYTKKIDRRLWTCGIKQLAPCLKIVSCPIQRLRCAHCLNHSGSRAAKQNAQTSSQQFFCPDICRDADFCIDERV